METIGDRVEIIKREKGIKTNSEFAKKAGIDPSYVTLILKNSREPSERIIRDICRAFDVSEEWLRNGTGSMYQERVDDLWNAPDVDDLDRKIITSYLKMTPDKRKFIKEWIRELAASFAESEQSEPKTFEEMSVEEQLEAMKPQLEDMKKASKSSATTTTNTSLSQKNKS